MRVGGRPSLQGQVLKGQPADEDPQGTVGTKWAGSPVAAGHAESSLQHPQQADSAEGLSPSLPQPRPRSREPPSPGLGTSAG